MPKKKKVNELQEECRKERRTLLKLLNNNVLAQAISDSKCFLFAGNRDGDIFVLNINDFEKTEEPCTNIMVFNQGDDVEINSLCFNRKFLVVGAIGVVYGLEWNEVRQRLSKKRAWEIKIPLSVNAVEVPDVNFMWLCKEREIIFAGCGDNNIYQIDLEDGRIVRTFTGHKDYIHGVVGDGGSRIFSASEDGTVRIWNESDGQCTATLELHNNSEIMRPELGGFVGAVAFKDDWLLCGGGPKLSLWHLSSMRLAEKFEFPGRVHVCDFVENEIVVGGEHKSFQIYSLNGKILADIPVDHTAVYSIAWQSDPVKFMSISGYDNQLHILKQFRFLDTKIPLYGNTADDDADDEQDDEQIEEEPVEDEERRKSRFQ